MKSHFKIAHLLILFFMIYSAAYSQEDNKSRKAVKRTIECDKKLEEAQNLYASGLYFETEKLLNEILSECSLSKIGKQDAYELLIRAQLETDKVMEADTVFRKLLKRFPNYKPNNNRVEEIYIQTFNHYQIIPKITFSVYFEAISPILKNTETFNTVNFDFNYETSYQAVGFSRGYGILGQYNVYKNMRLGVCLGTQDLFFKRRIAYKTDAAYYSELNEHDNYYTAGIELTKHFIFKKFSPYFGLVGLFKSLSFSNSTITYSYPSLVYSPSNSGTLIITDQYALEKIDVNTMKNRRKSLIFIKPLLGVDYKINNSISLSLNYAYEYTSSLTNNGNFVLDEEVMQKSFYIDRNFKNYNHTIKFSINFILSNYIYNKISQK
jgi:hypothetical protein